MLPDKIPQIKFVRSHFAQFKSIYGQSKRKNMPSVIVKTGFETNKSTKMILDRIFGKLKCYVF